MKKGFFSICNLFKIDWISTIIINFTKLPFRQALKIPILLYKAKVNFIGGGIKIDSSNISFGMIKLGIKHEPGVISKGFCLNNRGSITFKGAGVVGNGSVIIVKKGGHIVFGRNFGITGDFTLHCHKSIVFGDNLSCSWSVSICDTDLVLKGTVIPDWCVIAAMSLVNKEYHCPNFSVIAGIPAKVLNRQIQRCDIAAINLYDKYMITSGLHLFNGVP